MIEIIALILSGLALSLAWHSHITLRNFSTKTDTKDLPKLLKQHHLRQTELKEALIAINGNQHKFHSKLKTGIRKSGFVRFNPYRDTGGDQSFCLAMLDDQNNGYVLTAVHGREGTRIYAKNILRGEADHKLSNEESSAINQALSQN